MPIEDIPSLKKLSEKTNLWRTVAKARPILWYLGRWGRDVAKVLDRVPGLAAETEDLVRMPDRFNSLFLELGWIAYEHLSLPVMKEAVRLGEEGNLDLAERHLCDHYDERLINVQLLILRAIERARPREHLLRLALQDYVAGRYHASVPVVLAQADGLVYDLAEISLFTTGKENKRLHAWDSIGGHPDAVTNFVKVLSRVRKSTSESEIQVPYAPRCCAPSVEEREGKGRRKRGSRVRSNRARRSLTKR